MHRRQLSQAPETFPVAGPNGPQRVVAHVGSEAETTCSPGDRASRPPDWLRQVLSLLLRKFHSLVNRSPIRGDSRAPEILGRRIHPDMIALERRIVFDGTAPDAVEQVVDASDLGDDWHVGAAPEGSDQDANQNGETAAPSSDADGKDVVNGDVERENEIAFVDASLSDLDALIGQLPPSIEVVFVEAGQDGVAVIVDALGGRNGIEAVHIISHGGEGWFRLGSAYVDAQTMSGQYANTLSSLSSAFAENGDILVYGCDFAGGAAGEQAAELLGSLTGTDVAASTDDTGNADLGGDWDLEFQTGAIEASSLQATSYGEVLAPLVVTPVGTGGVTATTLAQQIIGNDVTLVSATLGGSSTQAGTFSSATGYSPEWLAFDDGVVFSTGLAQSLTDSNANDSTQSNIGTPGTADFTAIGGFQSFDASYIDITFVPTNNQIALQFVFGSDEYNEYVYASFNDAIGVWVNGVNIAVNPSGAPISIDTINDAANYNPVVGSQTRDANPANGVFDSSAASLFVNNDPGASAGEFGTSATYATEMDGFTRALGANFSVNAGVANTIRIGVADIGDPLLDSWLLVASSSFQANLIANDDFAETAVNTPQLIDVLANDLDFDADEILTVNIADQPIALGGTITLGSGAQLTLNTDWTFTYTPAPGATGDDLFTYTVTDNNGNTATAYVHVDVGALTPPRVDLDTTDPTGAPVTQVVATENFESTTYSGGAGWVANWQEAGEPTNPTQGDIRIVSDGGDRSIQLTDATDSSNDSIQRTVDLSTATAASLAFDFRNGGLDDAGEAVLVQVSSDGINYTTIAALDHTTPTSYTRFTYDISAYMSASTTVRLVAPAAMENDDFAYLDNIEITSTEPTPPPADFATSTLTYAAPVSVASLDAGITDTTSTTLSGGTIELTNPQTGDSLAVNGALVAAGATGTIAGTSISYAVSAGGDRITLSGTDTLANYASAIEAIGFATNGADTTTRSIEVRVVDDSGLLSNVARSTITVELDTDADGVRDVDDIDDDNDGILDTAEGAVGAATFADPTLALADQLDDTQSALFLLDPAGSATLPGGGVTVTVLAGDDAGNQWQTFQPPTTSGTITAFGVETLIQTEYLDLIGNIPRTIEVDFGTSASSLATSEYTYHYVVGVAGLGPTPEYSTITANSPLTVVNTLDVFNSGSYSLLDGSPAVTPGQTGTVISTAPTGAQGYTFYSIDESVSALQLTYTGNDPHGLVFGVIAVPSRDTDSDGIADHLDIDSDNDGITDNVEAQATAGYVAPTGNDSDGDGLDDAYEGAGNAGLSPVDPDGDGTADYIDTDSDNDGIADIAERGDGAPTSLTSTTDTDGDGLLDIFEGADTDDGFDVNDENVTTAAGATVAASGEYNLAGTGTLATDLSNVDGTRTNLAFRDADTDDDGVDDPTDIDDDNDGILDVDENPVVPIDFSSVTFTDQIIRLGSQDVSVDGTLVTAVGSQAGNAVGDLRLGDGVNLDFPPDALSGDQYRLDFDTDVQVQISGVQALSGGFNRPNMPTASGDQWLFQADGGFIINDPNGELDIEIVDANTMRVNPLEQQFNGNPGTWSIVTRDVVSTITMFADGDPASVINVGITGADSDGDGLFDSVDIDSDNDGITDNVEAQATAGYVAPHRHRQRAGPRSCLCRDERADAGRHRWRSNR